LEKEKLEEYKAKLEKFEENRQKQAKLFNIDEVLANSGKIQEKYVPELDCIIRYGRLTLGDMPEIAKGQTDEERALRILWRMLSKADTNITLEKVERLPMETATAILRAIVGPLPQTGTRLNAGSKPTRRRN